jgi:hypothetical protein
MQTRPNRLVIYAKDVMYLTGKQKQVAYRILGRIRKRYDLQKGAMVTVNHFCSYTGMRMEEVLDYLRKWN